MEDKAVQPLSSDDFEASKTLSHYILIKPLGAP